MLKDKFVAGLKSFGDTMAYLLGFVFLVLLVGTGIYFFMGLSGRKDGQIQGTLINPNFNADNAESNAISERVWRLLKRTGVR